MDSPSRVYTAVTFARIDIEIHTGDTGNYQQAVIHIDSIAVESKTTCR